MSSYKSLAFLCLLAVGTTSTLSAQSSTGKAAETSAAPANQRIVIKVGDSNVTKAQFDQLYADFRKANEGGPVQRRDAIADNYAGTLMLSKQGVALGLDKDPEIMRQLELNRLQILSNAAFERLEKQAEPTSQEIEAYYNAHLNDFDEVDIRRLFIYKQTPNSNGHGIPAQEAKARANEIRKVLATGGDAKQLIADTKDALDAEPLNFKRGELPGPMANAFDMKVGEWSEVADTPEALVMFVVVKKDRQTLSQASAVVERTLQSQKLREEMEALKKKTGVWMDKEYFSAPVAAENGVAPSPSEGKRAQEKD